MPSEYTFVSNLRVTEVNEVLAAYCQGNLRVHSMGENEFGFWILLERVID